jgi:hypothetical protein
MTRSAINHPLFIVGVGIIFVGVAIGVVRSWLVGYTEIARLNCGGTREVRLLASNDTEPLQSILYQVYENGNPLLEHRSHVGSVGHPVAPGDLAFSVLSSSDNSLIGIATASRHNIVFALHDFSTGKSWPGKWEGTWTDQQLEARDMLAKLQASHTNLHLRLIQDVNQSLIAP